MFKGNINLNVSKNNKFKYSERIYSQEHSKKKVCCHSNKIFLKRNEVYIKTVVASRKVFPLIILFTGYINAKRRKFCVIFNSFSLEVIALLEASLINF